MSSDNKVVPIGKEPVNVTPDMLIRWLMSNMDKVQNIAIMVKMQGEHPQFTQTTNCSQYFLALAASVFQREAVKGLSTHSGYPKEKK